MTSLIPAAPALFPLLIGVETIAHVLDHVAPSVCG